MLAQATLQRAILDAPRMAGRARSTTWDRGIVQRALIPLVAENKPGRLPENERTLKDLLNANGFERIHRDKARSLTAHREDLNDRMTRVLAVEEKFQPSLTPAKRRNLRAKLAFEYEALVDAADGYRDDADSAYHAELTSAAEMIRSENPTVDELFKGGELWKAVEPTLIPSERIGKFVDTDTFAKAVRARYRQIYKVKAPAASSLNPAEVVVFNGEMDAIQAQLESWKTKGYNAPGCNANGTWGTSKAGAGDAFNPSSVSAKVWVELRAWWRGKPSTYVTPSDTSNYSLKKHRQAAEHLSPTFNYHINVG
jgi:hypothetical protein